MKIMQVITRSDLGGAQNVVVNLSNYFSSNHQVILVAGGQGKMWKSINKDIICEPISSLNREISFFYDLMSIFSLIKLYFKYRPDIIHLHSSKIGILGRLTFPSSKVIYTVHGFDSIRLLHRVFLPLERFLQKKCKFIVGVSKYDEHNLLREGIHHNVCCIYNGIPFPIKGKRIEMSLFDNSKKKILCIARMERPKRFDLFLDTAKLLPQYEFIWIGNLKNMKNLPTNVHCLGNISDAGYYNAVCDLFMLCSDFEGLPIVLLEALSYGKPIVASNVGGIGEIVIEDENGYLVDNNPIQFVEKIKMVLENDNLYDKLSKNALIRFEEYFTIEIMANNYFQLYEA